MQLFTNIQKCIIILEQGRVVTAICVAYSHEGRTAGPTQSYITSFGYNRNEHLPLQQPTTNDLVLLLVLAFDSIISNHIYYY